MIRQTAGKEYIVEYLGKHELFYRIAQGWDHAIETPLVFEDTGGATYKIDVVLPL